MNNRKTGVILIMLMLLTAFFHAASGQRQHRFFYGTVADESTRRPLPGVNLKIGARTGTSTDKTGNFSFFTDSLPVAVTVSHIGYQPMTILLDETSYRLTIYLKAEPTMLAEVEITSKGIEAFFEDRHYSVLDYDIDGELVCLLVFRQRLSNSQLILLGMAGDTIAVSQPFTFRPRNLFRDCIGTLHLLSADSGFQVYRQDRDLKLVHPVKLKKFDDVLRNCVASTASTLYFRKVVERGLSVEYFGADRNTMSRKTLSTVADKRRISMTRRNRDDAALLDAMRPPTSRDDFVTWNYLHKVLYRPVKSSLYMVDGYIAIFNIPSKEAEFYDTLGNFSYKLALQADRVGEGRWTEEILIDKATGMLYTVYLKNGKATIFSVSRNDGAMRRSTTLEFEFPERISVHGGKAYFLYDDASAADNKRLFRQRLE